MAWQWRRSGVPFRLLSRVGDDRPDVFRAFLDRHGIPSAPGLVAPGRSASIDIVIQPDLQPFMDNFVEGVWATFRLQPDEEALVGDGGRLHLVLVEGAIRELRRLAGAGVTRGVEVTADFLGFRHYTVERLADTMADVDIGFVGWPGGLDDPAVAGIRGVAHDQGKLVVVTFGAQGVRVFDGRAAGGGTGSSRSRPCPCAARRSAAATRSSPGSSRRGSRRGTCSPRSRAARRWVPRPPPGGGRSPTRPTATRQREPLRPRTRRLQPAESANPRAAIAVSN